MCDIVMVSLIFTCTYTACTPIIVNTFKCMGWMCAPTLLYAYCKTSIFIIQVHRNFRRRASACILRSKYVHAFTLLLKHSPQAKIAFHKVSTSSDVTQFYPSPLNAMLKLIDCGITNIMCNNSHDLTYVHICNCNIVSEIYILMHILIHSNLHFNVTPMTF
jgi:hypothetical protein